MTMESTFVIGDDGIAYLYRDGQVVASSPNIDELEKLAQDSTFGQQGLTPSFMPQSPTTQTNQPCINCGQPNCPGCAGPSGGQMQTPMASPAPITAAKDREEEREEEDEARVETDDPFEKMKKSTHIITPNGVKGKIVGYAKGMWGDEVTVRLDNGRIAKYDLVGSNYTLEDENATSLSPFRSLQSKLDEVPAGTLASLYKRLEDLTAIKKQAKSLAFSSSHLDIQELDNMIVIADHETREVREAISALEQETYTSPEYGTAAQISMRKADASWLDDVMDEALAEAQATDYDRLMEEGPETLVAEVETPMLTDSEAVANSANDFVTAKTVGLDPKVVGEFRQAFLARVEEVREREVTARYAQHQASQKTASAPPQDTGPDEGLFF